MTLDQLQQRDARIAEIEATRWPHRTQAMQDELGRLLTARDHHWRNLPRQLERARRKAAELEAYARQVALPLDEV